jgi:multimeric flavodoxin WrbA
VFKNAEPRVKINRDEIIKIVGIQSSPRGKHNNTLKLLNAALYGASEAGADVESIDIAKMNQILHCVQFMP